MYAENRYALSAKQQKSKYCMCALWSTLTLIRSSLGGQTHAVICVSNSSVQNNSNSASNQNKHVEFPKTNSSAFASGARPTEGLCFLAGRISTDRQGYDGVRHKPFETTRRTTRQSHHWLVHQLTSLVSTIHTSAYIIG